MNVLHVRTIDSQRNRERQKKKKNELYSGRMQFEVKMYIFHMSSFDDRCDGRPLVAFFSVHKHQNQLVVPSSNRSVMYSDYNVLLIGYALFSFLLKSDERVSPKTHQFSMYSLTSGQFFLHTYTLCERTKGRDMLY